MARRTFEQWIDGIFDHPVAEPAWFWEGDADTCEEEDAINAAYLGQLFSKCDQLLRRFDNAQVGQGLNLIVNPSCSSHAFSITGGRAPWPLRKAAIHSIYDVYAECFASRCAEGLCHLNEVRNPLNAICYMWWDVFPARGDCDDRSLAEETQEYISVMQRCLSISHHSCLEGALHGLGHWQMHFPEQVESIIDRFLKDQTNLRPELVLYARRAKIGVVQ